MRIWSSSPEKEGWGNPEASRDTSSWASTRRTPGMGMHGAIPEALYGILEHQKLRHGTRTLQRKGEEVVGVYIHERNAHKAKNYAIWTPVFGDGYYWRVNVEVKWDPAHRVPAKHHDQTVVDTEGVHISAFLVEKRSLEDIPCGNSISKVWNPLSDAHPFNPSAAEAKAVLHAAIGAAGEAVEEAERTEEGEEAEKVDEEDEEPSKTLGEYHPCKRVVRGKMLIVLRVRSQKGMVWIPRGR